MDNSTLESIEHIVVALSALGGFVLATRGLSTWRKELHGKAEYELARDILINAYALRDALYNARNPGRWKSEYPEEQRIEDEKNYHTAKE